MKREEIIRLIEAGMRWEEEFVLKYNKDVVMELIKTLQKGKSERIIKLLNENISDTKRHASMISELLDKIRSGEYEL